MGDPALPEDQGAAAGPEFITGLDLHPVPPDNTGVRSDQAETGLGDQETMLPREHEAGLDETRPENQQSDASMRGLSTADSVVPRSLDESAASGNNQTATRENQRASDAQQIMPTTSQEVEETAFISQNIENFGRDPTENAAGLSLPMHARSREFDSARAESQSQAANAPVQKERRLSRLEIVSSIPTTTTASSPRLEPRSIQPTSDTQQSLPSVEGDSVNQQVPLSIDVRRLQQQLRKSQAKVDRMMTICLQAKVIELERKDALRLLSPWRPTDDPDEGALHRAIRKLVASVDQLHQGMVTAGPLIATSLELCPDLHQQKPSVTAVVEDGAPTRTSEAPIPKETFPLLHPRAEQSPPLEPTSTGIPQRGSNPHCLCRSVCAVSIPRSSEGERDRCTVTPSKIEPSVGEPGCSVGDHAAAPISPAASCRPASPSNQAAAAVDGVLSSSSPALPKAAGEALLAPITAGSGGSGSVVAGWIPGRSPSPKHANITEQLRANVARLKGENARLREEADVSRDNLRNMMLVQEEEMSRCQQQAARLEGELGEERRKNTEWLSNIQFLESQLAMKNMDLQRIRAGASEATARVIQLDAERVALGTQLSTVKARAVEVESVMAGLKCEAEGLRQEVEFLRRQELTAETSQRPIMEAPEAPVDRTVGNPGPGSGSVRCNGGRDYEHEAYSKRPAGQPRFWGVARNVSVVDAMPKEVAENQGPTEGSQLKPNERVSSATRNEITDRQHSALLRAKDIVIEKLRRRLEYMEGNEEVNSAVKLMAARESAMELEVCRLQGQISVLGAENSRLKAASSVEGVTIADIDSLRSLFPRYVNARQTGNQQIVAATLPILCALLKLPPDRCAQLLKAEKLPQPRGFMS